MMNFHICYVLLVIFVAAGTSITSAFAAPISIVEEICEDIKAPCAQIEIHPTHERLEVGLVWLNDLRI